MLRTTFLLAAAAGVLATAGQAQHQFLLPLGVGLNLTDESIGAGNALGFSFTMPDGTVVTSVDVDSNGRVLPPGSDTQDFTETVGELLSEAHASICPRWDDLNPNGTNADDVYFNTDGSSVAWITWHDIVHFGASIAFTFQCQLYADGHIAFVYDSRCPTDEPLVGLSPGSGAADPGSSDLSANPFVTTLPTVYEDFTACDLRSTAIGFLPSGSAWAVIGNAASDLPPRATIAPTAGPCEVDFVLTPNQGGGYDVTRTSGLFDATPGTPLITSGDDALSAGSTDLTFAFPWPDGVISQFADADSNGRVLRDGTDASDYTPSIAEALTENWPSIMIWTDFNINDGGVVTFSTVPGAKATFTWDHVAQYSSGGRSLTTQIQLFAGGTIVLALADVSQFNSSATTIRRDFMIGVSSGHGAADPGETDYSAITGVVNTGNVNYEFFAQASETVDLHDTILNSLTTPALNGSWDLQLTNLRPAASVGWILIGFTNPNLPLSILGFPGCTLSVNPSVTVQLPTPSSVLSIPIGASSMVGLQAFVQGVTTGGSNPALPLAFSNGLVGTVGI